jgi:hypothetical protein
MPANSPDDPTRKKFRGLPKVIVFFALVGALVAGVHVAVNHGLRRIPTSKFGSLNRIVSGQVNAEIVVNGSSRAMFHYDPRVITAGTGRPAYNLGMVALQINLQAAVLRTYLRHNARPALVIQNLDSSSLLTGKRGEVYDLAAFTPYLGEPDLYRALRAIDPATWKMRYIPMHGYAVADMRFLWVVAARAWAGKFPAEDYHQGFLPRYERWTEDFERYKAGVGRGLGYVIEPQAIAALVDVMDTCRSQGIPLVLVYSPEYFEAHPLLLNRAEIFAKFRELCAERQVPLWDYSDSPLSRDRANFYGSQHLNAEGAARFSADLARRLRESGLLAGPRSPGR